MRGECDGLRHSAMGTPICSGFENGRQSGLSSESGDWQNVGYSIGFAENRHWPVERSPAPRQVLLSSP